VIVGVTGVVIVVDAGGIVGGDAMSSGDGEGARDSVRLRRVRSRVLRHVQNRGLSCAQSRVWHTVRHRVGSIRRRLCFRR
jgi:hypothetical protein